jgi:hypothetical protein
VPTFFFFLETELDLNVLSQSEHQTYVTEENKEVR